MKLRDKQNKIPAELTEKLMAAPEEETDWQAMVQTDQVMELMEESLKELNKEQQECVNLFYLQKKSYTDIAASTGYSLMQVKSYIQNGKRNLKMILLKQQNNGR